MTWQELHAKGGLPADVTLPMCIAADRQLAGKRRLGPKARRSVRRLHEELSKEHFDRNLRIELREQQLQQDGTRSGPPSATGRPSPASSAAPRVPGAARLSAPRQPTPGAGKQDPAPGVGGALRKSTFDARTASFEDLQVRLGQLGISAPYMENRPQSQPRPQAMGLGVTIKQRKLENENEARRLQREKDLAAGALDARTADAEKVRERLAALGIEHDLQASIRESGRELPPKEEGPNPLAASLEARRRAERRARQAAKSGRPVDVKEMPDAVFREYLRLRKFAGGW